MSLKIETVKVDVPAGYNVILGQSHFIKTVEDLYETLASSSPTIKFGFAFCESSGKALIRFDGNDQGCINLAVENAKKIGAGHSFIVYLKDSFPINVLNRIKNVEEVDCIYASTGNPLKVIVADDGEGRGILGVIDGIKPKGVENEEDKKERHEFLRKIGYKK